MKLKIVYLLIHFTLACTEILAQNSVTNVTYKLRFNLETLPNDISEKYSSNQQELIKKKYRNYDELKYTLFFNSNESLFFLSDSIIGLSQEFDPSNTFIQKILKIEKSKKYYKNIEKNLSLYNTQLGDEELLISGSLKMLEWKLTKEKKSIGDYVSYKAILIKGRELLGFDENLTITAWYSPELPLPFGPMHFSGLPGLILELQLGPKTYYVNSIKFNYNATIKPLNEGKQMNQEQYSKFLHTLFENRF